MGNTRTSLNVVSVAPRVLFPKGNRSVNRVLSLFFCAAMVVTTSAPSVAVPLGASPAAVAAQPDQITRARTWLSLIQAGKIDRSQLTDTMNAVLTDQMVASLASQTGPFGPATAFTQTKVVRRDGSTSYVYDVTFANDTKVVMIFSVEDASGKVSGLRLMPSP